MPSYVFMTDSDSDLPIDLQQKYDIPYVKMPYFLEGKEYYDDLGQTINGKDFFDKMRAGATPSTSLLPVDAYIETFEPILKEGKDLLFISLSSKMSNTILNIYEAQKTLLEQYPNRKIIVVDTLSISAPQCLLILEAHKLYREGKNIEEVAKWVEDNKTRAHAWFTVDDLKYLKRGGRISSTSAMVGSLLSIKPILVVGKSGKMSATEKVQGRKKALRLIADRTAENIENPEDHEMLILHADALEEAEYLIKLIKERVPNIKNIHLKMIGPVIGAHCGPGTICSSFMGKERTIE